MVRSPGIATTWGFLSKSRERISAYTLAVGALATLIVLLLLYPLGGMIVQSLAPGGRFAPGVFAATFSGYGLRIAAQNTLILVLVPNLIGVPVGVWFAWINERTDARMGALSTLLPLVPLLVPPVVLSIGWLFLGDPHSGFIVAIAQAVVRPFGVHLPALPVGIQSLPGLIFLYALGVVPLVYVVCAAAFRQLDPGLEEASRVSGHSPLRTFFSVSFPAIRPAVAAGTMLGLIATIGLYSVPATIGVPARIPVLSVYIYNLIHGEFPPKVEQATVLGLFMIAPIAVAWLVQARLVTRLRHATTGGRGLRRNRVALGNWRWPVRGLILLYLVVTTVAPVASLIIVALEKYWTPNLLAGGLSFQNFVYFLALSNARGAVLNSVLLGVVCGAVLALICTVIGVFNREVGGPVANVLGVATKIPSAVPGIVFAVGVLMTLGFSPFMLEGSAAILLLAYFVLFLPQAMISSESAVAAVGGELLDASRVCGAGSFKTLREIALPLAASGAVAGWAIVFAFVMGDLNVAAILSGPSNPVIGYVILGVFEDGTYSQAAALGALISIASTVCVGSALLFARPGFERFGQGA